MNKKICILTATRAEYGLLKPIIKKLQKEATFEVSVVVTGAHLSKEFGLTYQEIEQDGIKIARKIEILLSSNTPAGVSKAMGLAMISFADYFAENKPDALLLLGDRYETLAVACAAANFQIPIFHLYGGETTIGAVDESFRHCLTKLSFLHFTSTEKYRKRVIQLGEAPQRVFNVGAIGVENAQKVKLLTKAELSNSLNFSLAPNYGVVTFHPETLAKESANKVSELLTALDYFSQMSFIITKANADFGGRVINEALTQYAKVHANVILVDSLGQKRYLSALNSAALVIGNSSSGIIEVPSFKIPTVNIGERQRGRIQAKSVINCPLNTTKIISAIEKALSAEFREVTRNVINPYEGNGTSKKIVAQIKDVLLNDKIDLKKPFFDVSFKERE